MWEKPGSDTPISTDNVIYIITTGKDNSINIPCIDDGENRFGVLYFKDELAINMAEFNCKVAKMKGRKALEMFRGIADVTAVALQSTNQFNGRLYDEDIDRILAK